ncbi:MAG: MlaD family protein [Fimbriimonadaceae bacterium]
MTRHPGASAVRVGILVVIATVLLYVGYIFLGGQFARRDDKKYFVQMSDAGGVVQGTRVSMAGVHIGEVEHVKLQNPRLVLVELAIERRYSIPAGSEAEIPTQFISIGEAGMVIVPPTVIGGEMPEGSVMQGHHPGPLEGIFPDTKTTIQTINDTLAAMRDLLKDEDLKGNIKHLLTSSTKTLEQFEALAARTNKVLVENQAPINSVMSNAALAMADVHKSTQLLNRMMREGKYPDKINGLLANLDATTDKAGKLMDSLNSFVSDPALRGSLKTTMDNAAVLTEQGKQIATKTGVLADNGIELTKHVTTLTDQAGQVAGEAKVLLAKLEQLVDKVDGKVDKINIKLPKSPIGSVHASIRALRDTKPNYNRVDANFMVPLFGEPVYFGLFDAFASNKLNLQLGKALGKNGVFRYGAYAGTEGLGVDYSLAPRLGLSADVFNANKPRFDALAKYEFTKGYDLWFGLDRIFDRNGFTIGLGIQK